MLAVVIFRNLSIRTNKKRVILKDIFPGLSRTKVLFQNFPGPGIFNNKKSRTFQEAWEPCSHHTFWTSRHRLKNRQKRRRCSMLTTVAVILYISASRCNTAAVVGMKYTLMSNYHTCWLTYRYFHIVHSMPRSAYNRNCSDQCYSTAIHKEPLIDRHCLSLLKKLHFKFCYFFTVKPRTLHPVPTCLWVSNNATSHSRRLNNNSPNAQTRNQQHVKLTRAIKPTQRTRQ